MTVIYNPSVVNNGLVLSLDANNKKSYIGSGSVWRDLSLSKNNCTLFSSAGFNTSGNIKSISMDGTINSYASIVVPQIELASAITVEGFMKWKDFTNGMFFGLNSYSVYTYGNTLGFNNAGSNVIGISTAKISELGLIGAYKHYAFVMYKTGLLSANKIYINSTPQLVSVQVGLDGNNPTFTKNFFLSGWENNTSYRSSINYSNFRIYNRELSLEEINQNYNAHKRFYINE